MGAAAFNGCGGQLGILGMKSTGWVVGGAEPKASRCGPKQKSTPDFFFFPLCQQASIISGLCQRMPTLLTPTPPRFAQPNTPPIPHLPLNSGSHSRDRSDGTTPRQPLHRRCGTQSASWPPKPTSAGAHHIFISMAIHPNRKLN